MARRRTVRYYLVYRSGHFIGHAMGYDAKDALREAKAKFGDEPGLKVRKMPESYGNPSKRKVRRRVAKALKKYVRGNVANPPRVKGRKTKGGRAVTLKNFTGTIVKKSDGTVQIVGRGRRK